MTINAIGGAQSLWPKTSVRTAFLEIIHKSPAERMRDSFLKSHGLTEEDLANMSSTEREKIEDEIKRLIQEKFEREAEKKGRVADVLV